jgi:hypothetical protein
MRAPLDLIGDLMSRPPITEVEHLFADALAKYLYDDLPLNQALRIPGTPDRLKIALRDFSLCRAAQALPDQRPCTLTKAVQRFMSYKWAAWQHCDVKPFSIADDSVDAHLWRAAKWAELPKSHDAYTRILARLRG